VPGHQLQGHAVLGVGSSCQAAREQGAPRVSFPCLASWGLIPHGSAPPAGRVGAWPPLVDFSSSGTLTVSATSMQADIGAPTQRELLVCLPPQALV
jgi:hypothetical protein